MAVDLVELLTPSHTVLVTQECQRGVVGDLAALPELADEARRTGMLGNVARLARAARAHGVEVVHCLARHRGDRKGGNTNARLFAAMARLPEALLEGTPSAEPVPELEVAPSDIVLSRYHGLGPMGGTDLDAMLRNLGTRTVVGVGVSLNVGMLDFAFDAVNGGYRFVLPRDATAGVPAAYASAVLEHTLSLVASVVTTDEVVATWEGSTR